jgi:hypothetical protein
MHPPIVALSSLALSSARSQIIARLHDSAMPSRLSAEIKRGTYPMGQPIAAGMLSIHPLARQPNHAIALLLQLVKPPLSETCPPGALPSHRGRHGFQAAGAVERMWLSGDGCGQGDVSPDGSHLGRSLGKSLGVPSENGVGPVLSVG